MHKIISCLLLALFASLIHCAIPEHRIESLPGLNAADFANFEMYAGYITVDSTTNRNLFYWFVQSTSGNAGTDPVTVWLNGGPGCSSLEGLLSENGPLVPGLDSKTLMINPYSWTNVSNMLYIEAPAGVGFSYSDNPDDYNTNDEKTAQDNYIFLMTFFQNYPEFSKNDFYIAGESYAGHYVPMLAQKIYEGNQQGNPFINIKGYAVGNGVTDDKYDLLAVYQTFYSHALIPISTYNAIVALCPDLDNPSNQCQAMLNLANNQTGDIYVYDIYEQTCPDEPDLVNQHVKQLIKSKKALSRISAFNKANRSSKKNSATGLNTLNHPISRDLFSGAVPQPLPDDPCVDVHLTNYLNLAEVKAAIHANPVITWAECTNNISYTSSIKSMVPIYQNFLDNVPNFKIMKYSGDVDTVVPYLGTAGWIENVLQKGAVLQDWTSWTIISTSDPTNLKQQVAGYYTLYQGRNGSSVFYFVTVKGAGHMVPLYKPQQAFYMFSSFIKGTAPGN